MTHTPTPVSALVGMLNVSADRAGEVLPLTTVLLDDAGQPVIIGQTADAPGVQMRFETALDLTTPTEVLPGMNVRASFAIAVPSLPLRPGRYVWSATVGGHHFATDYIVPGEAVSPEQWRRRLNCGTGRGPAAQYRS